LIALSQFLFVDVLQDEGDGFLVQRFHRANSTLIRAKRDGLGHGYGTSPWIEYVIAMNYK
jgi:hypothetical protein